MRQFVYEFLSIFSEKSRDFYINVLLDVYKFSEKFSLPYLIFDSPIISTGKDTGRKKEQRERNIESTLGSSETTLRELCRQRC